MKGKNRKTLGRLYSVRRLLAGLTAMTIFAAMLSGCGASPSTSDASDTDVSSVASEAPSSEPPATTSEPSGEIVQTEVETKIINDLSANLDKLASEDQFSGAVLLAKGGEVLYENAYGYANRSKDILNAIDTKFNMASIGKIFTATAIMQLIEDGKLSLDSKLIDILPDYPNTEAAQKISIQHLLTHTSGLGDIFTPEYEQSDRSQYQTHSDYLSLFANTPLSFEPGEKHSYSNAGYIVLGLVVEALSSMDYFDYVNNNIFKPTGMNNTGFYSPEDDVENLASGYTSRVMGLHQGTPDENSASERTEFTRLGKGTSAGGVYSTTRDMLLFAEAICNNVLVGSEYVELLFKGNGFVASEENGARIVGHSGGNNGVSTNIDIYPDLGYVTVILSNYDEGPKLFNERLRWQLKGNTIQEAIALTDEQLQLLVGQYKAEPPKEPQEGEQKPNLIIMGPGGPGEIEEMPITVEATLEGLRVNLRGSNYLYVPVSPVEFYDFYDPRSKLTFETDGDGEVIGLSVTGGLIRQSAMKIEG